MTERKPLFAVISGPVKSWKTTSVQEVWGRDSLTILTNPDIMHYYISSGMGKKYGMPKRRMLLTRYSFCPDLDDPKAPRLMNFDENGEPKRFPANTLVKDIINKVIRETVARRKEGLPPEYPFIIIDEGGELFDWRAEDMRPFHPVLDRNTQEPARNSKGEVKVDTRAVYGSLNEWTTVLADKLVLLKAFGVGSVVLTHSLDPDIPEGKKGGPKFGSKGCSAKMGGKAEISTMSVFETVPPATPKDSETTRQYWRVTQHPDWELGVRGLTPEKARQSEEEGWPLERIVRESGW